MKIDVMLSEKAFKAFNMFDVLERKRRWVRPCIYGLLVLVLAVACFFIDQEQSAPILSAVLVIIAIALPCVYFETYFSSLKKLLKALKLNPPRLVYSLNLSDKSAGIHIDNENETVDMKWRQIFHVYTRKDATYLFITSDKGYIIPDECVPDKAELMRIIESNVDKSKISSR